MSTVARPGTTACKIYVGPLSQNTKDIDLWKHFQDVGPIREAVVLKDKLDPTKSRGFGFVVFQEESHVQVAIDTKNRTNLIGNSITVAVAGTSGAKKEPQEQRSTDRDWTCASCSINNFSFRVLCYRCGGPRPASAKNWGNRSSVKAGDWICKGCHKGNFPFHRECRHCQKPIEVPADEQAPAADAAPQPLFSPHDTALMANQASNFVASIGAKSGFQGGVGAGSFGSMGGVHGAVHNFSGRGGAGVTAGGGRGFVGADGVTAVGSGRGKGYDAEGNKIKLKHSDWQCPVCWAPNNKYREQCNINGCVGKKPPMMRRNQPSVDEVGQNLRRMKWEDGDWECPTCGNHNFKNRDTCNASRCEENRPFTPAPVISKQQQRSIIAPKEWSWY